MGRQPTSGYCETCRRRRVKCDKTRPECGRCLSSGHRCGGYDTGIRMQILGVQSGDDGRKRLARISTSVGRRNVTMSVSVPVPVPVPVDVPAMRIPPELGLGAFQQEVASACFFETYGWAPFWKHTMLAAAADADAPDANRACLQAIVYGYAGIKYGDAALRDRAARLYGLVLRAVRSLIGRSDKAGLARLTVTMMLMDMYEFTVDREMSERLSHHLGIESILQHCGPDFFQRPALLQTFRSCRALLLCQNVCRRRRTFLQDEPWKTIPWKYEPKSFEDRLMDLFLDLPGIAQDLDVCAGAGTDECLARLAAVSAGLRAWRRDWDRAHGDSVRKVWRAAGAPPDVEYDSPRLALDILYYDAAAVYLMQIEAAARAIKIPSAEKPPPSKPTSCVFFPEDLSRPNKPAAEALAAIACIMGSLPAARGRETVVTPAPIGIVYSLLQSRGPVHALVRLQLAGRPDPLASIEGAFEDAQRIFGAYHVTPSVRWAAEAGAAAAP